ncbi:hypothetical protein PGT21_006491 [Puccinia graminis f. sp. tritici]|uniref:Uncharacterized protein n=1 Tax=Puccinia graminis f. sp. tritici TaxID=56615 RepID=A0A5B0NJR9_PUCGR|nr:hypothetical protein PGTUg99_026964 [Puccinia graminis f. sp. tritici]KAA1105410.1 hypothetical protein PGT21_006491 [Puccinia graminis f. sp. tritici]
MNKTPTNPAQGAQPSGELATQASDAPAIPTLLDGSQDSGGDDSLDLISKNPELPGDVLKEIAEKTAVPPEPEGSVSKEREHIWSKIKLAQAEGDDIVARALLSVFEGMGAERPVVNTRSVSARPILSISDTQTLATSATVTETEGDLVYAVGAVTSHQDIGFTPYFDENIKKLRAPIPLTIFDKEWQKKALTAHMLLKPSKSGEDKAYRGLAYHDEWTQTHSSWTNNHRSFYITLRDVYNKTLFAEKLLIHKANCDAIADVYGFMTAFRYDMQIRMNAFAHRITSKDGAAIPDITVKQDVVIEQCYSVVRSHGETAWKDNYYAPGGSHAAYDPDTGCKKPELARSNSAPSHQLGGRQNHHFNRYNNAYGHINNSNTFVQSNHQDRRRENHRGRYGGNLTPGGFNNNHNYNNNYDSDHHSQSHQFNMNSYNYDHGNPNYGGDYHNGGGDGRKRFRSSGKGDSGEKQSIGGAASGSKP